MVCAYIGPDTAVPISSTLAIITGAIVALWPQLPGYMRWLRERTRHALVAIWRVLSKERKFPLLSSRVRPTTLANHPQRFRLRE
jgi:hypothetical protein